MINKRLTAIACIVTMVIGTVGCNKTQTVEEYPSQTVVTESVSDGENDSDNEVIVSDNANDSIRNTGKFVYNPTKLNPVYKDHISEEMQLEAQMIMEAVYNHDLTIDLSSVNPSPEKANMALDLAKLSTPLCEWISLEEDLNGVFRIIYPYEDDVMQEKVAFYTEELTNAINERITPEDSDADRALIMYKYLIEEIELDYEVFDKKDEDMAEGADYEEVDTLTAFYEKHADYYNFFIMYVYVMIQLDVESNIIGSMGNYVNQGNQALDDIMFGQKQYIYNNFAIGDQWYYCDILFDKIVFDSLREDNPNAEFEPLYFGMSDETRAKSWSVLYKQAYFKIVPSKSAGVPVCEEDLEF